MADLRPATALCAQGNPEAEPRPAEKTDRRQPVCAVIRFIDEEKQECWSLSPQPPKPLWIFSAPVPIPWESHTIFSAVGETPSPGTTRLGHAWFESLGILGRSLLGASRALGPDAGSEIEVITDSSVRKPPSRSASLTLSLWCDSISTYLYVEYPPCARARKRKWFKTILFPRGPEIGPRDKQASR